MCTAKTTDLQTLNTSDFLKTWSQAFHNLSGILFLTN